MSVTIGKEAMRLLNLLYIQKAGSTPPNKDPEEFYASTLGMTKVELQRAFAELAEHGLAERKKL